MEVVRNKPRVLHVLRSIMLAGAGAVVWMALSSTAANADSGNTNSHTLLGGAESAVTNVVHSATSGITRTLGNAVPVEAASVPAPAAPSAPVPAVQLPVTQIPTSVVRELPRLAQTIDHVVANTPVVNVIVPERTVGAVTAPVVSRTTSAVDRVESGVSSLVGGVIVPALGAVGSTVDAIPVDNLPVAIPGLPAMAPGIRDPGNVGTGATLSEQPSVLISGADALAVSAISPMVNAMVAPLPSLSETFGLLGTDRAPCNAAIQYGDSGSPAVSDPPSGGNFPNGTPGRSTAGNSSAALLSNPSGGVTAWIPSADLFHPRAGSLVSTAAAGQIPAPVSFDPGSSPD